MGELNGTIPWDLDNLVVDLHTSKPICVVHLGQVVLRGMNSLLKSAEMRSPCSTAPIQGLDLCGLDSLLSNLV